MSSTEGKLGISSVARIGGVERPGRLLSVSGSESVSGTISLLPLARFQCGVGFSTKGSESG